MIPSTVPKISSLHPDPQVLLYLRPSRVIFPHDLSVPIPLTQILRPSSVLRFHPVTPFGVPEHPSSHQCWAALWLFCRELPLLPLSESLCVNWLGPPKATPCPTKTLSTAHCPNPCPLSHLAPCEFAGPPTRVNPR